MEHTPSARIERRVTVQNKFGIHVRPSTRFVEEAQKFKASIKLRIAIMEGEDWDAEEEYDGKSVLQLLQIGASQGTELFLSAEGEDAQKALETLEGLFINKFGFED